MVHLLLPLVTITNLVRLDGEPDYHQPSFSFILIVVVLRQRSSSNSPVEVADRTVGPSATEIKIKENFTFHIRKCFSQKLIQYVDDFQANQKLEKFERKSIHNEESSYIRAFILILSAQLDRCFARPQYPQVRKHENNLELEYPCFPVPAWCGVLKIAQWPFILGNIVQLVSNISSGPSRKLAPDPCKI